MIDPNLENLLTSDHITATVAGLMALRQHQLDEVAFRHSGLDLRVTDKVTILLAVREQARRQAINRYAQALYLQSQIGTRRKQINQLVEDVKAGKKVDGAIEEANRLQTEVEELTRLLAGLNPATALAKSQPPRKRRESRRNNRQAAD